MANVTEYHVTLISDNGNKDTRYDVKITDKKAVWKEEIPDEFKTKGDKILFGLDIISIFAFTAVLIAGIWFNVPKCIIFSSFFVFVYSLFTFGNLNSLRSWIYYQLSGKGIKNRSFVCIVSFAIAGLASWLFILISGPQVETLCSLTLIASLIFMIWDSELTKTYNIKKLVQLFLHRK